MRRIRVLVLLCCIISIKCQSNELDLDPCKCKDVSKTNCFCVDSSICDPQTLTIQRWGGAGKVDRIEAKDKCGTKELCCHAPPDAVESRTLKCGSHALITGNRIVSNNYMETLRGEYPWVVAISLKSESGYTFKGFGSIIHPQVILTGHHNLKTIKEGGVTDEIQVVSGVEHTDDLDKNELNVNQQLRLGKEVIFHSRYIAFNLQNDTALIILKEPFELNNYVRTICLPPSDYSMTNGTRCLAIGWEPTNRTLKYAQKVTLPLVERGACLTQLRKTDLGSDFDLHGSFICAGGEENEGTCVGDGGTPLVCDYDEPSGAVQVGILSWGVSCRKKDVPSVFVNVPVFVDWIKGTLMSKGIVL